MSNQGDLTPPTEPALKETAATRMWQGEGGEWLRPQGGGARSQRPWVFRALMLALLVAHYSFLMHYFAPAISSPDANGYYAQARRIALDGGTGFAPESPLQYVGVHWLKTGGDWYCSRYPPGLALLLAAPFKLGGYEAALRVAPVMATLTLIGLYLVCALWAGEGWAFVAAAAMALNPVANERVFAYDSHTAAAFFLVWGIFFLAWWAKGRSPWVAFIAGLCLGVVPTIRYPEALFGVGAAFYLLAHLDRKPRTWLGVAAAGVGAFAPIAALLMRNHAAFGAFWKTGYSLTNEQTGFGWSYFQRYAAHYLENIMGNGAGLFAGLGAAGMAAACARRRSWREGVFMAVLVAPTTLLYMAYYWSPGRMAGATMRFLLPTFFVYAIAGVWCLQALAGGRRAVAVAASAGVLGLTLAWGLPNSMRSMTRLHAANAALAKLTSLLAKHAPAGSVVVAGHGVQQHLDFVGRWKLVDESILMGRPRGMMRRLREADPDAPSPMQREKMEDAQDRYYKPPGSKVSGRMLDDLIAYAKPTRKVYWLGDEAMIKRLIPWTHPLKVVAKIQLPKMQRDDARGRPGMGGMPGGAPPRGRPPGRGMRGGFDRMRRRPRGGPGMGSLLNGETLALVEWTLPAR